MGIMTLQEISNKYKVHPGTIYNWRKRGMPVIKQGGTVRYDETEVDKWLKSGDSFAQNGGDTERSE